MTTKPLTGLGSPKAYQALAAHLNAIRLSVGGIDRLIYEEFIVELARSLAAASDRFNPNQFLADCGVTKHANR